MIDFSKYAPQFDALWRERDRRIEAMIKAALDQRLGGIIRGGKIPAQLISGSTGGGGMENPMTTASDIIVGGVDGAPTRLAKGTDGQVLKMASGAVGWGTDSTSEGGGGEGATIHTSAYASPPASPASGDLWLPSDSAVLLRYSGAAWVPWGPVYPLTIPPTSGWSWVNQGAATIATTAYGQYLEMRADNNLSLRIRVRSAPGTPYTITVMIVANGPYPALSGYGLVFRQSADGKLVNFACGADGTAPGRSLIVQKFSNATTFSASYQTVVCAEWPRFLRIADDGTNRVCSVSHDGVHFLQVHSVGRTDFLTADEVGFYVLPRNATYGAGMHLLSWKEA